MDKHEISLLSHDRLCHIITQLAERTADLEVERNAQEQRALAAEESELALMKERAELINANNDLCMERDSARHDLSEAEAEVERLKTDAADAYLEGCAKGAAVERALFLAWLRQDDPQADPDIASWCRVIADKVEAGGMDRWHSDHLHARDGGSP